MFKKTNNNKNTNLVYRNSLCSWKTCIQDDSSYLNPAISKTSRGTPKGTNGNIQTHCYTDIGCIPKKKKKDFSVSFSSIIPPLLGQT